MVAEYLYMNIKILLVPLLLLWVNVNLSAGVSISKRSIDEVTKILIQTSHDEIFPAEELKGFEIFKQEFDTAAKKTIYTSLENPKSKFIHAGDDVSSEAHLVILDPLEDMIIRKNLMVMFLVLRKRISDPKTFTSHLAYIRPTNGEINVEWDYFKSDESRRKWSFVNAFTSAGVNLVDANRKTREIMAAPGLVAKKAKIKSSSSSEETAKKKKKKAKKPPAAEEDDDDKDEPKDEPPPADCKEEKKGRRKRKAPKVVYKININHIICANGGECKPDPCLGRGKKGDKGRALSVAPKSRTGEELFEGIGKCEKTEPPRETSSPTGRILTGEAQMIEFILQTLRIQCVPEALPQIQNLFKQNLISSNSNFQLELNRKNPLFNVSAPGEDEWIDISSALFFKIYTNTYFEEAARMAENTYHALSPKRDHISSSIEITTLLVFKTIPYFTEGVSVHVYKIISILENMLQARYSENIRLRPTLQTEQQKAINLNDCMQILCLNKLINIPIIEKILAENVDKFDLDNIQSTVKLIEQIFNKMYIESFDALKASALNAA